jgi:kynureninase
MSNAPVLSMAAHRAALELYAKAGMPSLRKKSAKLTGYADALLREVLEKPSHKNLFSIITPNNRGCQLSLLFHREGRAVFDYLLQNGIIGDWREPNVIRIAPVPLYNSFTDVYKLAFALSEFPA